MILRYVPDPVEIDGDLAEPMRANIGTPAGPGLPSTSNSPWKMYGNDGGPPGGREPPPWVWPPVPSDPQTSDGCCAAFPPPHATTAARMIAVANIATIPRVAVIDRFKGSNTGVAEAPVGRLLVRVRDPKDSSVAELRAQHLQADRHTS